ncbi:hypothetical protein SAMN05428995_105383 [Loktanella sp. DSM 29012]|uniref:hypothetical protein n=1 Tax=Loktanella sp. DSM 29012 TaxID=1881056 RepID=UPI0008CFC044|nr:hypothetical protein [Loktanella sp. DSM 29012]SEQ63590.1 hypothetical protein SAMN05428995_105383 [Loktanella sp. DSM 29012]
MTRFLTTVSALAWLAACGDGQPLFEDVQSDAQVADDDDLDLPPGTEDVSASSDIFRFEARNSQGGGLVTDVSYNAANDTFSVDNLGFDGENVYTRKTGALATLGTTRVYEADATVRDFLTGDPVSQIVPYVALYGVSKNRVDGDPRTSFAIVRTGGYAGYGFGGYVYERNGGTVLPNEGQATFSGDYAGVRVFAPARSQLEYVTGQMSIDIDFEDFNANDAVKGAITNRRFFDENGVRIVTGTGPDDLQSPNVPIIVVEGSKSLSTAGEIEVELQNFILNESGVLEPYEGGKFTGIIAGDTTSGSGGEIVGVVVLESEDPRFEGITAQETGGVILYR